MSNFTRGAQAILNERSRSIKESNKLRRIGFTEVFSKERRTITRFDKFLGEHTVQAHVQIGWKCNKTGKITKI